jgi:3'-phosphoadenosine 5'-phosphosulfate sulfotransferase (PAPS reductase)/FAD synthetase
VLIDVTMQVAPDIEVVFLDTQYRAETLWYVDQIRELRPELAGHHTQIDPDNLWQIDTDACCEMRKVEPLSRARRQGRLAAGLRRRKHRARPLHRSWVGTSVAESSRSTRSHLDT